jgi:putative endopeptidase
MRRIALLVLLTCASVAFAQDSAPKTSFISDNLDKSVDPCVDFYQYSCGNWLAKHPIPADRATYGTGAMVFDQNLDTLHEALEVAANPSIKRSAPERRAGDYYAACMDERGIDAAGTKPLAAELARINAITTKAGLAAQIAHMHAMGMRDGTQIAQSGRAKPLFDFTAGLDDKNATKVIPIVDAGGIALPDRDMYVDQDERSKELREGYVKHVTNMFKLLGESPEKAAADANTVMAIETDLAKVSMTRTDRRDPNSVFAGFQLECILHRRRRAANFGLECPRAQLRKRDERRHRGASSGPLEDLPDVAIAALRRRRRAAASRQVRGREL